MKITDIDYYAEFGESWLNKLPARAKILTVAIIIATVVFSANVFVLGGVYVSLLLLTLFSAVPKLKIIKMSLYPLLFLALFLLSINNLTTSLLLIVIFKALSASLSLVLLIFTTSYIKIFSVLKRFLPGFMVNVLFLTYRSIFILAKTLENLMDMLKFRGKLTFQNLGNILGLFVIKSIQTGENMYDAMKLRGYDDQKALY